MLESSLRNQSNARWRSEHDAQALSRKIERNFRNFFDAFEARGVCLQYGIVERVGEAGFSGRVEGCQFQYFWR